MTRKLMLLLATLVLAAAGCGSGVAKDAQAPAAQTLRFVVVADNQPFGTCTLGQPAIFKQIVPEVAALHPAFVMNCGDHISGYTEDLPLLGRMWDEYFALDAGYKVPSYHVPGNHDVWDDASAAVFEKRVGRLYHSFDYGDGHFIILNSESQQGPRDQIAGEQLAWLKHDLETKHAAHTFVFLHKPLWLAQDWRTYQANPWDRDVHPLLKRYGVTAVFGGHCHNYEKLTRDGLRYFVAGSAGGPLAEPPNPLAGDFFCYCLVTVQAGNVSVSVIKPNGGGVFDENIVRYENVPEWKQFDELWNMRAKAWSLRRQGRRLEAAELWKKTLAYADPPGKFTLWVQTAFEELESDLRAAGRLDDYAKLITEQAAAWPGEEYATWRDETLARIALERGDQDRAAALYRTLLARHGTEDAVVGQVYHDVALGQHAAQLVKIKGEDFSKQGGGKVRMVDKACASGKSFVGWDNPGHWLEWGFTVPSAGRYYVIVRFAQGFQDEKGTCKIVTIDGAEIERSFFWYSGGWSNNEDDWGCKVLLSPDRQPRQVPLQAGTHTLHLEGAPGKPKGLNIDYILLVPAFEVARP